MAYVIVNNYIPQSLYSLKSPHSMVPESITIHNTYNDATAANEIAYMHRNTAATSYHVAIDDKQVVQAIPFSRNGWHAGDGASGVGNRKSIGIEICYSKSGGQRYVDAEANTIEYIAHVLKQYNWGINRVKWHRDWSGKNCPHRIISEGRLQSVKDLISKRLNELNTAHIPKKEVVEVDKEKGRYDKAGKDHVSGQDFVKATKISDGEYPKNNITREQVWTMLERMHRFLEKNPS